MSQTLRLAIPRRAFFTHAVSEMMAVWRESAGQSVFTLSSLEDLPEEALGGLVPALIDVTDVHASGADFVLSRPGESALKLFSQGSFEEQVWALMDGRSTLREMAEFLGGVTDMPVEQAMTRVCALFLKLVRTRLCLPLNPLE